MDQKKQQLPPKENALFKRILKCYEQKQYKNGLKFAKQILTNYPDHGETLSMKGLILNCLCRKEEAYNFVRLGLRSNLQSHVCWHVFGLLQRSDRKYDEAIKCYRNALKWDKDNLQILRDLSLLQIQMRDLEGYKETRYKLFELRPTQRASWIGYAMSFHLLKDYEVALKILEEFRRTIAKTTYDYEYSELLLYQNLVIRESGNSVEALKHLDLYESNICDKVTFQQLRGELLISLNQNVGATEVYRNLIKRNPENRDYYLKLEEAMSLTTTHQKLLLYDEMKRSFPKARVPQRLQLNYAEGEALELLLDVYLRASLQKGITPLFTDIKSLYDCPKNVTIIDKLMNQYIKNAEISGCLNGTDESPDPSVVLYVMIFCAQHYRHLGDNEKALELIEKALIHTPTLIELYLLKGKILKRAGDTVNAYKCMQEAQTLDTADRYVNSKAAAYLLNANQIKEAEEMCSKFTRDGVSATDNLNEMQCMWFQTACAHAFHRLGRYGDALKKCHEVDRHFTEIIEDQFDFHTYCMRKMTLWSYVELLRLEDVIRNNRFFWEAARTAISIYLRLHDYPVTASDGENALNDARLDPAELKKLKSKQRKAAKKAEQNKAEERKKEEKKAEHYKSKQGGNHQADEVDATPADDLDPHKLEHPAEPLVEAMHFLRPLLTLVAHRIDTHLMAFEIYLRRMKPLLMLQALKRATRLKRENPELHRCLVQFLKYWQDNITDQSVVVIEVVKKEMECLVSTFDPVVLNEDFLNSYQKSLPHRLQAARAMVLLDSLQADRAQTIATALDVDLIGRSLTHSQAVLEWLESPDSHASDERVALYKAQCRQIFPRARIFFSAEETSLEEADECAASENSFASNHNHVDLDS